MNINHLNIEQNLTIPIMAQDVSTKIGPIWDVLGVLYFKCGIEFKKMMTPAESIKTKVKLNLKLPCCSQVLLQ